MFKGKSTQSKRHLGIIEYIYMPWEMMNSNNNITISGEILFVNKIPLLITTGHIINYTTIKCIRYRNLMHLLSSNNWKGTSTETNVLYVTYGVYMRICYRTYISSVTRKAYHMVHTAWILLDITVRTFDWQWDTRTIC